MHPLDEYFRNCLYFSAGALSRAMGRMAEEEFAGLGFSPSHAFLLMLVLENPGASQKELGAALHLAPSTVTRFVDAMERKGFMRRKSESRTALIYPTAKGEALGPEMEKAWNRLYKRYCAILGQEEGDALSERIFLANQKLAQG